MFARSSETLPGVINSAIAHYGPAVDRGDAGEFAALIARVEQQISRYRQCHNPEMAKQSPTHRRCDDCAASVAPAEGDEDGDNHK